MKVITNKKLFYRVQFFSNERNVLQLTFPANFICTLMSAIHRWKQIVLSLSKKARLFQRKIARIFTFHEIITWQTYFLTYLIKCHDFVIAIRWRSHYYHHLCWEQTMQQQSADLTLFCSFARFKPNFLLVNQAHKISQVEKIPVCMQDVWFQFFVKLSHQQATCNLQVLVDCSNQKYIYWKILNA